MNPLNQLVERARHGDLDAFGDVVKATQAMAFALAASVLRDFAAAEDVVQEAYLIAFRRLRDLSDAAAFLAWFRRIVIKTAIDARRARRQMFLQLDDVPEVPVLDEAEASWTVAQRRHLARALMALSPAERRLCDRRYHGGWMRSVEATMPGLPVRLTPTTYPMCREAWDVDVERDGRWWEMIAFGVFTDRVVAHLGADPATHTAIGAGYGLERLAMLRYGIDDIRKVDVSNVA